jgi:viroplasmin and RNaseH domain-containing protein
MVYYAVANGKTNGIFLNWNDCFNSINNYSNAIYKKFNTKQEAENFILLNNNIIIKQDSIIDFSEPTNIENEKSIISLLLSF